MRQALIKLTYYNSTEQFRLNPNHIVLLQRSIGGASKITLVTDDEVIVQESPEEVEALLNE